MISLFTKIMLGAFTVLILLGGLIACSPLRAINALTPSSTYQLHAARDYGPDPRQKLDIYTPAQQQGPAPVVVFFYGGNWNSGSRTDYAFVGEALASRGIVSVIADYRLYPAVRYPAFLEDSGLAVAWTAKEISHYGGDPKQLFVMGHSAGAYNAAMVALDNRWLSTGGLTPSILKGWIGLAGPYDFIPIENKETRPVFHYPDTPPESQPINQASAASPPALLLASSGDTLVNPTRNTGGLAARLRMLGVPVREIYFDRTSHTTLMGAMSRPLRALAPVLDQIDSFVHANDDGKGKVNSAR